MLSAEQNEKLARVGPGTPMGELLRRYWHPIAGESEFETRATKPVRIMGENLVLYKDLSGNFGLMDRHCPHRRADMACGMVEPDGLRCSYHGWMFNAQGACTEQPFEDTANPQGRYKDKVTIKAYPVRAHAGLLWAYMGPLPAPELPDWEPFSWKNGFRQIVISELPCNWLQGQENSMDPIHFEWMHANWSKRLRGETGPYGPKHLKIDFREYDYGFTYNRIREDTDETNPLWTIGRACLWPNAMFTGDHFEYRVPIDDETMMSVGWFFTRVPRDAEPYVQESIPVWYGPIKDERGEWITSHVMNQDFVAWIGQGTISDRTQEHLGLSDKGIGLMRRQFLRDMERIKGGEDPKAIIRDPAINKAIPLPTIHRDAVMEGMTAEEIEAGGALHLKRFIFQYGQPAHVLKMQQEAMRISQDNKGYVDA
ncbi:MAG: aromatic ring-hydroxylating dioxygenase subunit alpha [Alphaproteobacteria bacterium]|nr:aromatic ring-hydroxylating dioxygenase subunit alpha [Alphaproteobacteria bacterium]MBU0794190.1 aromatic ring-hydroxylating dioxygenase subunit alpha [Alphaproteobacteria bacterium]MBU0874726.1 aromatic ring-hydroxylating dioxygenase subunit alpha [Alphaproteobacteria bacterium]MBU1768584.1 aromatic ring-hydroxylating dioxygenase subunit alpha [Alphaproteobacteria bacterium]